MQSPQAWTDDETNLENEGGISENMASANGSKARNYYRVTFQSETGDVYQLCARSVGTSDLYGMIEMSEFLFPETGLVYNPGEERLRKEFANIRKTWTPYHAILRIDEVDACEGQHAKIIAFGGKRGGMQPEMLKKP